MLKLIKCEFYKFKRRSLFVLATLVALVFPVVMTALYWNIPTQVNYDNLFSGIVDYGDFLLLLPILVVICIEYRIGNNALSCGFTLCGISCMVQ